MKQALLDYLFKDLPEANYLLAIINSDVAL